MTVDGGRDRGDRTPGTGEPCPMATSARSSSRVSTATTDDPPRHGRHVGRAAGAERLRTHQHAHKGLARPRRSDDEGQSMFVRPSRSRRCRSGMRPRPRAAGGDAPGRAGRDDAQAESADQSPATQAAIADTLQALTKLKATFQLVAPGRCPTTARSSPTTGPTAEARALPPQASSARRSPTTRSGARSGYSSGAPVRLIQTQRKPAAFAAAMSHRLDDWKEISAGVQPKRSVRELVDGRRRLEDAGLRHRDHRIERAIEPGRGNRIPQHVRSPLERIAVSRRGHASRQAPRALPDRPACADKRPSTLRESRRVRQDHALRWQSRGCVPRAARTWRR